MTASKGKPGGPKIHPAAQALADRELALMAPVFEPTSPSFLGRPCSAGSTPSRKTRERTTRRASPRSALPASSAATITATYQAPRKLRAAIKLGRGETETIGHKAAWSHAEDATSRLMKLITIETRLATVEA